ncbi:hypothetical protein JL722_8444 [Aureococcus anophagefferens]|nr:hypothetical protein JL722_8444 [Aureococcus anophagefferens]
MHPRVIAEGYDLARDHALEILDKVKVDIDKANRTASSSAPSRGPLTKLQPKIADLMTDAVVDAVLTVRGAGEDPEAGIDLHMVEVMTMEHKLGADSRLRWLVLDHASRHPDMPKKLENCKVLTCNVSLEYEKSEVASGFFYSSAEQREQLIESERKFTDDKKGIDPLSLDMLAKEGIFAARRAKRRNMERIAHACGGTAVNCFDDLEEDVLGYAGVVYEVNLGEENYTFIDEVKNPLSCTLLLKGPNKHTIEQIKDAVRDGLRAVAGVIEDGCVVPGGGAFEVAAQMELCDNFTKTEAAQGKKKFGIMAFADSLLIVPKILAENAGHDVQESIVNMQDARTKLGGELVGLDLETGKATDTASHGIWDNYRVKKQYLHLSTYAG